MENMDMILRGGKVYSQGKLIDADVLVRGGRIEKIGQVQPIENVKEMELRGGCVLPGLVDVHVHFREPGFSRKETIATGTRAAAHGGYTTVCTMPNLNPAPDSFETLEAQLKLIREEAVVRVIPYGTITMGQKGRGELARMEEMAPYVVGFSDDGCGVQSEELMRRAMQEAARLGKPIVAHCEVDELVRGGYIHDGEYAARNGHKGICSESEWRQIERDVRLAEETGCQYHVCHVSTKESVEIIRQAKARGVRVTCETAPHYLIFCDEDLQEEGRFKMNPPLRSSQDRQALRQGIADGTIDVIATDHAPHTDEEKSKGLAASAFGIVGIETAFALVYTYMVKGGNVTFDRMMELLSSSARRIFGLGGGLAEGEMADLAVFDLDTQYTIDPNEFLSMGRSMPFGGMEVNGKCLLTLVDGRVAYADNGIA